jgi:hypothetical protein
VVTGEVTWFDDETVDELRSAVAAIADVSIEGPQGWSPSEVDPHAILGCFTELRLREGFELRAFQLRSGGNGNGVVWAVPAGSEAPVELAPIEHELLYDAPRPADALEDVMEAIVGDRTPRSYLSASIFAREIAELGALWHGISWGEQTVLGSHPDGTADEGADEPGIITGNGPWTWQSEVPVRWRPSVTEAAEQVIVVFYTYDPVGMETISMNIDRFTSQSSMRFDRDSVVIATGGGGFVF